MFCKMLLKKAIGSLKFERELSIKEYEDPF